MEERSQRDDGWCMLGWWQMEMEDAVVECWAVKYS